jgi:hypothetical protein
MFDVEKMIVIAETSIWLSMSISFVNMIKWLHFFMIWSCVTIAIFDELTMIMIEDFHQKITKKRILSSNLSRSLLNTAAYLIFNFCRELN